jgi:hypothetical protein
MKEAHPCAKAPVAKREVYGYGAVARLFADRCNATAGLMPTPRLRAQSSSARARSSQRTVCRGRSCRCRSSRLCRRSKTRYRAGARREIETSLPIISCVAVGVSSW